MIFSISAKTPVAQIPDFMFGCLKNQQFTHPITGQVVTFDEIRNGLVLTVEITRSGRMIFHTGDF